MSPEQVGGEKLDPRSDIYSFALIVYEMVTGGLPFHGQNTQAVMISRLTTSPRPLRMINPDIPPAVEAAVMHALERDRDVRTPTAGQFVAEFDAAIGGRGPNLGLGQTRSATAPHPTPDTAAVRSPMATPPGSPPVMPAPFTPSGAPPVFPTDRAPNPAPGYAPTAAEPSPFAPRPFPVAGPPPQMQPQMMYQTAPQPVPRKGGGAGIVVGVLVLLLLLGGGAALVAVGYSQGWFSKGATGGPGPTPGPTTNPGTTDTADAERLYQEGYELQAKNDNSGAIAKYRAAIAKQPQFPKAYRNLGAALVNSRQYEDAIKALNTAVQQDPTANDQVSYNLGLAHFKLKNYAKAADFFDEAAKYGDDPDAYALAGFALDNSNNSAKAEQAYRKYLTADPNGKYAEIVQGILDGTADVPPADEFEM
jgi:serine/threonine-protein kinase